MSDAKDAKIFCVVLHGIEFETIGVASERRATNRMDVVASIQLATRKNKNPCCSLGALGVLAVK